MVRFALVVDLLQAVASDPQSVAPKDRKKLKHAVSEFRHDADSGMSSIKLGEEYKATIEPLLSAGSLRVQLEEALRAAGIALDGSKKETDEQPPPSSSDGSTSSTSSTTGARLEEGASGGPPIVTSWDADGSGYDQPGLNDADEDYYKLDPDTERMARGDIRPSDLTPAASTDSTSEDGTSTETQDDSSGSSSSASGDASGGQKADPTAIARASTGPKSRYSEADLRQDLQAVLQPQSQQAGVPPRSLGGNQFSKWTPAQIHSLYEGIMAAHKFYPTIPIRDLARVILAEGAQESTGDFEASPDGSGKGKHVFTKNDKEVQWQGGDHRSYGFMQATPGSVISDYFRHGDKIVGPDGKVILDPNGKIDVFDPKQSVALWAWYTANSLRIGTSLNQWDAGQGSNISGERRLFQAHTTWLSGPSNDKPDADYNSRIMGYLTASGFFTKQEAETLLQSDVSGPTYQVHKAKPLW